MIDMKDIEILGMLDGVSNQKNLIRTDTSLKFRGGNFDCNMQNVFTNID